MPPENCSHFQRFFGKRSWSWSRAGKIYTSYCLARTQQSRGLAPAHLWITAAPVASDCTSCAITLGHTIVSKVIVFALGRVGGALLEAVLSIVPYHSRCCVNLWVDAAVLAGSGQAIAVFLESINPRRRQWSWNMLEFATTIGIVCKGKAAAKNKDESRSQHLGVQKWVLLKLKLSVLSHVTSCK